LEQIPSVTSQHSLQQIDLGWSVARRSATPAFDWRLVGRQMLEQRDGVLARVAGQLGVDECALHRRPLGYCSAC